MRRRKRRCRQTLDWLTTELAAWSRAAHRHATDAFLTGAGPVPREESVLHESLTIYLESRPDDWRTFNTHSLLGGSLLGQTRIPPRPSR